MATRGEAHRESAASLGAHWIGAESDKPPVQLDRAITFAPSGAVVLSALSSLRKGGIVAINAIHLDHMPAFDFLKLAGEIGIKPQAQIFSLDHANEALQAVKHETANGPCVIVP